MAANSSSSGEITPLNPHSSGSHASLSTDLYGYGTEEELSTDRSDTLILTSSDTGDSNDGNSQSDAELLLAKVMVDELERMTGCQILVINLPWFGLALMYLILTVEVVPAQVEAMVGQTVKGTILGLMVALGAIMTLIISPLLGLISDRLHTRIGKRRPVMLVSAILLCLSLMGMAFSTSDVEFVSNSTETECHPNLTAQRCEPYTGYSSQLQLDGPHLTLDGKQGVPQTVSVGFPLFDYMAKGNISVSMGAYLACYLCSVITYTGIAVPYNALIADKTHPDQRGVNSGVMGGMLLLGNIGGACLGLFIANLGLYVIYGIISGVVLLCITITLLTISETHVEYKYGAININFRWLFFTRFMMQQGVSTVFTFIQYWVSDMVDIPNCWSKEKAVAILMIPLVVAAALCSVMFGLLSDRIRRRKPLVIVASILMSASAACFTLIRGGHLSYYITLILVFVSGIGYGTYLSVDFALLLDILPAHHDKAKDIAVWNQALILPQILATPIGGFILDFFEQFNCELGLGYIILFALTALYFFVSGIFVIKIDVP